MVGFLAGTSISAFLTRVPKKECEPDWISLTKSKTPQFVKFKRSFHWSLDIDCGEEGVFCPYLSLGNVAGKDVDSQDRRKWISLKAYRILSFSSCKSTILIELMSLDNGSRAYLAINMEEHPFDVQHVKDEVRKV